MAQKRSSGRDGEKKKQGATAEQTETAQTDSVVIETIRDLLFGERAAALESTTEVLAQRLDESLAETRSALDLRIERLGEDLSKQISDLGARLSTEVVDRGRLGNELSNGLEELDSGLRKLLSDESTKLVTQIEGRHRDVLTRLESELASLSDSKADRDAVAGLLDHMADKLRG